MANSLIDEFGRGWRITLFGINFFDVKDIAGNVLEVESTAYINGADVGNQNYALVGDKMRLIRLEEQQRALRSNIYSPESHHWYY